MAPALRDDISISCDDDLHLDCLGTVHGYTWTEYPPMPCAGQCLCPCHPLLEFQTVSAAETQDDL